FHHPRSVRIVEASGRSHVDQRRARAFGHAIDDLAPAVFVVSVAKNLLIGMAPIASSFFSSPVPDRLASHSEPVICAAISGEGGKSSALVTRDSVISSSGV